MNQLWIDDIFSTSLLWSSINSTPPLCWNVQNAQTSQIFYNLFPSEKPMVIPLSCFNSNIDLIQDTHIIDIHFIPHSNDRVFNWMKILTEILAMATQNNGSISVISTRTSDPLFDTSVCDQC